MSLVLSLVLGSLGIWYLLRGKRTSDGTSMLIGGALIIASYVLF